MLNAYLNGLGTAFSLILVIGTQNAFVLKQGLRQEHVSVVVLICALSDAILISVGVFGFAALTEILPSFGIVMLWLGAAFLFVYGAISFWRAWQGGAALDPAEVSGTSLRTSMLFCLAITWLNPHVYLDTVFLIGSIASQFKGVEVGFWAGAVTSSFMFFAALGYGARLLAPVMARHAGVRALGLLIGSVMWVIGYGFIFKE